MPNDIREIEREKRNEVEDEYIEKKENLDKKEKELIKQENELNKKIIAMENEYNLKFAFLKKWEEDITKRERDSGKKQRKWASIWRN